MNKTKPKVFISSSLTGKMKGMICITTSCLDNPDCIRRAQNPNGICSHCYAMRYLKMRPNIRKCYTQNNRSLEVPLEDKDVPLINATIVRFESFGDLINQTHLENYIKIAKKNPATTFTLFTKKQDIIGSYLDTGKKLPSNFLVVLSQSQVDGEECHEYDQLLLKHTSMRKHFKIFRVFSKQYASVHSVDINCGARSCLSCRRCYTKNNKELYVNELLK